MRVCFKCKLSLQRFFENNKAQNVYIAKTTSLFIVLVTLTLKPLCLEWQPNNSSKSSNSKRFKI